MSVSFKVKIELNKLPALGSKVHRRLASVVREVASDVAIEAQRRVPVDTGALRASLQAEVTGPLSAEVHDGVSYGVYNEFGTSRMPARPFFVPAIEMNSQRFLDEAAKAVRDGAEE